MRILCIISDMGAGGAQRMMSYLLTHVSGRNQITLLTLEKSDAAPFYRIPESVRCVRVDLLGGRALLRVWRVLLRVNSIRKEIGSFRPDVVVSFMDTMNVTVVLSSIGLKVPVVISERNDPSHRDIGWFKSMASDCVYPLARYVVVQTKRVANYFPCSLESKLRILPNPVPSSPVIARPDTEASDGRKRIIGVGRLTEQKGFDRLIAAFKLVAEDWPDWDLVIIGEGTERPQLEDSIARKKLQGRVSLPGLVHGIYDQLASSHLMVFPSLYEGFPNALAEGLSAGLPAIGHSNVSGVEDLIVHDKTGLLVDPAGGPTAIADALAQLMADAPRRARYGKAARAHVAQWAPQRVLGAWEELLMQAAGQQLGPGVLEPARS